MRSLLFVCIASILFMSGCQPLSPRLQPNLKQQIDNQNGRIDEIESNQNSIKNELQIRDSNLDRILNGLINNQNNNSGLQILSGSGGLFLGLVGILAIFVVMMHYRQRANAAEKTADILAENIVSANNPELTENVFKAVSHTDVEGKVLFLVQKHERKKH